ncbi:MAG TPA: bifunctional UDP-N-acetylglucosamine diphosphorylase/glucosamine-1-phosphate N-acetyltransferase GlmU [Terriglobales bacterium]|nr:bifunctional UDP-N-acetylglucosamine diphosphorylase/glucosamine-1-phosphate N-acetyltransferase GlmU [Terriglobales bacterium]
MASRSRATRQGGRAQAPSGSRRPRGAPAGGAGGGRCALVILAAGKGTRLRSDLPKVLHQAGGDSLLGHVLSAAVAAGIAPADTVVVAGYAAERVAEVAAARGGVRVVVQEPQLGTGHAVLAARDFWSAYDCVLVVHGDMPLVSAATLRGLAAALAAERAGAVLATATPASPRAYGRIVRRRGRVVAIVEERQATPAQRAIRELNAGFYCFRAAPLARALARLGNANPHREYYLTDTIALLAQAGERVAGYPLGDADEILGINDRRELAEVDAVFRRRAARRLMEAGVTIYAPETVTIDAAVEAGPDTVLEAGVHLRGRTRLGRGCHIEAYSVLTDCELGDGVRVKPHSVLEQARVAEGAVIGPFSRLRPGAEIAASAHIGNFVEVKNARIGRGAKANHLAYLGDAEVGAASNIGAGTITCNYDGERKHRTKIGKKVFIGSNATLVAPLEIADEAYVGAGSVITGAVPAGALALGRARQVNKPGWVAQRRAGRAQAQEPEPRR